LRPSRSLTQLGDSRGTAIFVDGITYISAVNGGNDPTKWEQYVSRNAATGKPTGPDWGWQPPGGFTKADENTRYYSSACTIVDCFRRPAARHFGGTVIVYADGHPSGCGSTASLVRFPRAGATATRTTPGTTSKDSGSPKRKIADGITSSKRNPV
jgi:hypothetical protein